MKLLCAVDPDTAGPGVAFFEDGVLVQGVAAPDVYTAVWRWMYDAGGVADPHRLVIECPQTYDGRAAGGSDANVLIELARIVGRFEQMAILSGWAVTVVTPFQWKGNVPKAITVQRAWDALTLDERARCELTPQARKKLIAGDGLKSGSSCDVMDAVGLGLRALGRTGRPLK